MSSTKRISSRCSKHDLYSPGYSWKNEILPIQISSLEFAFNIWLWTQFANFIISPFDGKYIQHVYTSIKSRDCRDRDHMAVGFTFYNYLSNRGLSPLMLWVRISVRVSCTTLCEEVVGDLRHVGGFLRFPPTINTDRHDATEILLKVALNTINQPTNRPTMWYVFVFRFPFSIIIKQQRSQVYFYVMQQWRKRRVLSCVGDLTSNDSYQDMIHWY